MQEEQQRTTVEAAIRNYVMFHEANNASPDTLNNYHYRLPPFASWLASIGITYVDELKLQHLREYVVHLQKLPSKNGGNLSDTTIQQYAKHIRALCRWLEQEDIIEKPITTKFKIPRAEKKLITALTPEDVETLLQACEQGDVRKPRLKKALTARNRAIVIVSIDAGLRRKELIGLRLCDVDSVLYVLKVHRKMNSWQQVPISREAFKVLHDYLKKHRPFLAQCGGVTVSRKEDAVFLTHEGKPLTRSGLSTFFSRLAERSGIEDKQVYHHQCRRYMATTQLAMGRSPLDVQRQMGHTTLAMTNEYASLTIEHLRHSHEQYSPLHLRNKARKGEAGSEYWDE